MGKYVILWHDESFLGDNIRYEPSFWSSYIWNEP